MYQSQGQGLVFGDDLFGCDLETQYVRHAYIMSGRPVLKYEDEKNMYELARLCFAMMFERHK